MKKKTIVVCAIILAMSAAMVLYIAPKNLFPKGTKKLPELSAVFQMEEADVNSLIVGYYCDQLVEVWGDPDATEPNGARWYLENKGCLVVSTNNRGLVVVCGLFLN